MPVRRGVKKFANLVLAIAVAGGGGLAFYTYKHRPDTQVDTGFAPSQQMSSTPTTQPQAPVTQASFRPNQDSLQSILDNHTVRISVENPSEPIYGEKDGVPHGFNYEFAQLLFAQPEFSKGGAISVDTHHEVQTYQDVPRQLLASNNGAPMVDIAMDGLTFPDNTPPGVLYTNPYIDHFGYALIVQRGSPIRSAADLAGKTIGILQGDPDVKAFVQHQFPGSTIKEISDSEGSHFIDQSVDGHVVDGFIYDYPFAVDSIKGTDLKFAVSKLDGSDISYKIGVRAQDQNLLIYLNSAIGRVKNSQAYLDLLHKYFVSDQIITTLAGAGERTYTVKHGDTLNLIATSQLGAGQRYVEIQKRNNLPNPDLIMVGQHLVIPAH